MAVSCKWGGQRKICRDWLSHFSIWFLGSEPKLTGLSTCSTLSHLALLFRTLCRVCFTVSMRGAHGNLEGSSELEEHFCRGNFTFCSHLSGFWDIMRWHLPSAGHWLASVCAHSKLLLDFLLLLLFRFFKDHRKFKNHYINAKSLKRINFAL